MLQFIHLRYLLGLIFIGLFIPLGMTQRQEIITLAQCQEWARMHYPLTRQLNLIEQATAYNLKNASTGYYPQFSINGQASYQSAVTSLDVNIPNMEIPQLSKDQYRVSLDVFQPLTNGSAIKTRKRQIEATAAADQKKVEVDLYQLRERVHQLYFSLLLIDEKKSQLLILQEDINSAIQKTNAAVENGTATPSNLQLLQAESIKLKQQLSEVSAQRTAFLQMLAKLTQQQLSQDTRLQKPVSQPLDATINRPELQLFGLQATAVQLQLDGLENRKVPNLGIFAQAGYGRPGLNMLSNDFEPYFIAGLRLNWNLGWLYTSKNDKDLVAVQQAQLASQKETFLLNIQLQQTQQNAEVDKYLQLIERDDELIAIQNSIRQTAEVQLENGLISALDYINYLNAESKARQQKAMHQTQLLMAQYQYALISGN